MNKQGGGFLMGMIVGLLIGLALALGVALYVTKVPVPFVNKVPQRTADQDALETERNKNWDPNAPLSGKAQRSAASASGTAGKEPEAAASAVAQTKGKAVDPAATSPEVAPDSAPKAPLETAAARATGDGMAYFVQAGAYARTEDAEQQRARLAMLGFDAKITEREQAGRTVYRVRVGPYNAKEQADASKTSLEGAGVEAALVRVQK
jgi:cell division protein FtsN